MPFKKCKYRQQGKGKLGRYHATRQGTSVVRTAPAAASSASAAADRVGDERCGSGASDVDKSGSAGAIAAAVLVSMNPPVKQLARAEEAAQHGEISFLHHQMGSPGKTSDTETVQMITTHLDLPKGAGLQAVLRTLVRKKKHEEQQKTASISISRSSGDCTVQRPRRSGKPKVGLAAAKMFAHAVQMGMGPNIEAHCGGHPPLPGRPCSADFSKGCSGRRRQSQREAKACQREMFTVQKYRDEWGRDILRKLFLQVRMLQNIPENMVQDMIYPPSPESGSNSREPVK